MFRSLILLQLLLVVACGATSPKSAPEIPKNETITPPKFHSVKILATLPHDASAYTQGLLVADGKFYESTGQYGLSSLRRVDIATGRVEKREDLARSFFGEGLALDDKGKLYQLTWREGKAFVYEQKTFKKTATHRLSGEGWGVVWHDGVLYVSDGTSTIRVYDPMSFKLLRTIDVRTDRGALSDLNELEWVEGRLWANVYFTNFIAVINPESGVVEQVVDCTALEKQIENSAADVLNGIAYDSTAKKLYVTGKNWEKLFQIEVR